MAIKKQVLWDGTKFLSYVDLGNGAEDNYSSPIAKDALLAMIVSTN